jgi:crotonobetainyl-CoA:carnitine CoA-transferase CaiB-like acyl-CoA transferase
VLVVALEQAVAAPYCTSRLADAGARVIKIERQEGDFARGHDRAVHGESSYWVWIDRGNESITLDVKRPGDLALLERMLARADVFIQNLATGATERLGLGSAALRQRHSRLVTCDMRGYGGKAPERVGLKHPTIAPYGAFTCADGRDIVISIQNEREWAAFCRLVLRRPELLDDPRCADNAARVAHRAFVDGVVGEVSGSQTSAAMVDRLIEAQTAFGNVNSVHDLVDHPQLRTRRMPVNGRRVDVPASPWGVEWEPAEHAPAPALDAHGPALRAEFGTPS